jgi:lipopolysaccharide transport system ATP-binding protein
MYLRLAFAVAAHLEPEVLLVDEVLAVGDAGFQSKCLQKLTDVAREGRTVLFVSHSMGAISQLCRSAVWVEKGRVAGRGPAADVIARYVTATSAADGQWSANGELSGGQPARMLRAAVCASDGQPGSCVGFSRPFSFEFLYEIREPMCYTVTLRLRNQTGLTIFTSSERDTTDWGLQPRPPGIYRARVRIPGGLLAVGAYSLTFGVFDTVWEPIDRRENALTFEIAPDVNCTINEGVITPFLDWDVERQGN